MTTQQARSPLSLRRSLSSSLALRLIAELRVPATRPASLACLSMRSLVADVAMQSTWTIRRPSCRRAEWDSTSTSAAGRCRAPLRLRQWAWSFLTQPAV